GSILMNGSSITVNKTIGSTTLGAIFGGSLFTSSPFVNDSIVGGNVTIQAAPTGTGSVSLTGNIATPTGGTVSVTSPTTIGINAIDNSTGASFTFQSTGAFTSGVSAASSVIATAATVTASSITSGTMRDIGGSVNL